jgi:hypothetical protein
VSPVEWLGRLKTKVSPWWKDMIMGHQACYDDNVVFTALASSVQFYKSVSVSVLSLHGL